MKHVQNYSIEKKIGQGATGIVYSAKDQTNDRLVAIKELSKKNYQEESEDILRFKREAEIIAQLSHPNIIKLYDLLEINNTLYLVMEYFDGKNLKISADNYSLQEKVSIVKTIAETLGYIHSKDIIHRDMKPRNILVKKDSKGIHVKIIDFGLAYLADFRELIKNEKVIGSFAYISPEQTGFLRRAIDRRSDMYALGATFYELVTGQTPFLETEPGKLIHKHLSANPVKPSSIKPGIPAILDDIILKLMKKEPEERYQTAKGLTEDLDLFIQTSGKQQFQIGTKDKMVKLNDNPKTIGRDTELSILRDNYKKITNAQTGYIFITGPSGLGKSKLVYDFMEEIIQENNHIQSFKCARSLMNIPYAPFKNLFKTFFQNPETKKEIIDILKEMGDDKKLLMTLIPQISEDQNQEKPEQQQSLDDITQKKQNKNMLFSAINTFLFNIGNQNQNLVYFIDDIQWMDEDSVELLSYLSENLSEARILFITAGREEEYIPLSNDILNNNFTTVQIKLLQKADVETLVNKMLNTDTGFADSFYTKLYEKTLGNPYLLIEIIKTLHENKTIYIKNYDWDIDLASFNNIKMNVDISGIVLQRLNELKEEELDILATASLVGKEFTLDMLHHLANSQPDKNKAVSMDQVITIIDKARDMQLVKEDISQGKGIYIFIHDIVQQTLQSKIAESEKKQIHLTCAQNLEELFKDELDKHLYQIAYHYNNTDDFNKKLLYNDLAYKKAILQFSTNEAVKYLKNIVDHHIAGGTIDEQIINKAIHMGELCHLTGKIQDSFDTMEQVLAKARELHNEKLQIDIYLNIGTGYYYLNDIQKSIEYYDKAMELARQRGEEIKIGYPYYLYGSTFWFLSELDKAEENLDKAIKYLDPDDWDNKLQTYAMRAATLIMLGKIPETFKDVEIMESSIDKTQNQVILAHPYHCSSLAYSWSEKDFNKALDYSLKAYDYSIKTNNVVFEYSSMFSRGLAYFYQKKYNKSLEALDHAIELSEKYQIFVGIYLVQSYRVEAYLWSRKFFKANELAMEFLKQKDEIVEKLPLLLFMRARAIYLYFNDKNDEAISLLTEAEELYESTGIALIGLTILGLKAHFYRVMGKDAEQERTNKKIDQKLKDMPELGFLITRTKQLIQLIEKTKEMEMTSTDSSSVESSTTLLKETVQLGNIIKTSQLISSILDIQEVLKSVLEKTLEVTGAERGALLLFNEKEKKLEFKETYNFNFEEADFAITEKIINHVEAGKEGIVVSLANKDELKQLGIPFPKSIKSIVCEPLLVQDRLIGLLYMDSKLLDNLFNEEDRKLLTVFTSQAAISIENARLHKTLLEKARIEQEMEIATDIQTSMLPDISDTDNYEIAGFMRTATEVGGDFYDIFLKDTPHFCVFGDVSGHGLQSGLIMMMADVAFNMVMSDENFRSQELPLIYQKLNTLLYENIQMRLGKKSNLGTHYNAMYTTFRMFRFNSEGDFEAFGNDQAEPFICRADTGSIEEIESRGFMLGILKDATLGESTVSFTLHPGDILVLYSDGIPEAKQNQMGDKNRQMFGFDRLYKLVADNRHKSPREIIGEIIEAVDSFMTQQDDDITMLIMKKK